MASNYRTFAQQVHALGFNVTAIASGKKPGHSWREYQETRQSTTDLDLLPWSHASGLGAISGVGGLRIFDFDKCGDLVAAQAALRALGLPDSYPWLWRSGSGNGWGLAVVCFEDIPAGVLSTNGDGPGVFEAKGNGFDHLELRWRGCQTLLPPSQHPTGPGYRWQNGAPTAPPATVTADQVIAAFRAVTLRPQPATPPPVPTNGHGSSYAAAALRDELDHLSRAIEGTRNATLNAAAFALGQLVAGGELDRFDVDQQLLAVALHIGLGEGEAAATIKSGLDAGAREPRTTPLPTLRTYAPVQDEPPAWLPVEEPPAWPDNTPTEPGWLRDNALAEQVHAPSTTTAATPKPDDGTKAKPIRTAPKLEVLSIRDLLTRSWPEPVWAVPGLLPVGLTVVAGRPKIGKSWLCLQLMQAVATGGVFLGREVQRGPVLYLALEDPPRRLAERAQLQGWVDLDAEAGFVPVGRFRRGDGRQIAEIIRTGGYRLLIVDTLARAFSADKDSGDDMTTALTPIQEAAHAGNCAVVLIHHHNKLGAATMGAADGINDPDPLVNLQGSISIGGMADCILGMYRQKDKRGVLLTGFGRDVEEYSLSLVFDRVTCCWQAADADAPKMTDERSAILTVVEDLGPSTLTEINKVLETDKGNLHKRLQNMVNLGMLDRDAKGRYNVPELI